jgi:tetratricopeptide (TPR) repeat protein
MVVFVSGCSDDEIISNEEKGDRAFEEKSYKPAVQFWLKAIDDGIDQPDQVRLCHKIGKAYLKLSLIEQAGEYFEKAVKINPMAQEIQKELVRIFLLTGQNTAAMKKMALLKDKFEKDADYFILYGDLFMISSDLKKAEQMYREAALLDENNARSFIKLAMCLYQTGKPGEAKKMIACIQKKQVLAIPDLLLLSDYYCLVKDLSTAEAYILNALGDDPDNVSLKIRLCRFYLTTGMKDKAEKSLVGLEAAYPEDARFKLMLADLFLSQIEMDRAELMLKKAEKLTVSQSDYNLLMGKFWLFKGKIPYAVSHLKSVTDIRPGLLSAHTLLGITYFAGGQAKLAENSFVRALILNPNHVETLLVLAGLHYKNRDYKLALQYLEKAILQDPLNARAYTTKGLCLMEQNQGEAAAREFSKAYSIKKDVSSLFFLAQSLQRQGKTDTALEIYKDVMENSPGLSDALSIYTALLLELKKGKKALDIVDETIKKGYTHPATYYIGARVSLKLKDYKKAQAFLETAMAQENVPGYIYKLFSVVNEKIGENSKAEEILKQCIQEKPSYVAAWTALADLYVRKGNKTLAIDTLDQAVEKFPNESAVTGNLAWLLLENGDDHDRALDLARAAYECSPDKAYLMDTLGWAYFHKKSFSQAEWMLTSAEKLAPDKGIIKYHQGMLFYKQGKLSEAKDKLKSALEYGQREQDKNQIKQVLADLDTDKSQKTFDKEMVFDPEAPLSFPMAPKEDDDILEPDWSQTLKKSG